MTDELKKGQSDWHKYVNDHFKDLENGQTAVTVQNPVTMTNGVTCESSVIKYVQLKNCKEVSLVVNGITIPDSVRDNWAPVIGNIPDQFLPHSWQKVSMKFDENAIINPNDGSIVYWWHSSTLNKDDTKGYTIACAYFTKN